MESIILDHARLIGESIDRRIDFLSDKKEEFDKRKSFIRLFEINSLKSCRRVISFISQELSKNDSEIAFFLIPHVRTLLDIYSRFLHLDVNSNDQDAKALTLVAYGLLVTKNIESPIEFEKMKSQAMELIKNSVLEEVSYETFDFKWIRKNKLHFAKKNEILKEEIIKPYSIESGEVFKGQQLYKIYSAFSEMNHGNPYYLNESTYNQNFWVITLTIQITSYLIEFVDRRLLYKTNSMDLRTWLKKVQENKQSLLSAWTTKPNSSQ